MWQSIHYFESANTIKAPGSQSQYHGGFVNASIASPDGRYPFVDSTKTGTTEQAAQVAWEVVQGFFATLPQLDNKVKSKEFHLATESYGGHWGPAFFRYFAAQNGAISSGMVKGVQLDFGSLTIINGIIDSYIQTPFYPEFAIYNTYGLKVVNRTVYDYMRFALHMPNGCLDQIAFCSTIDRNSPNGQAICAEATYMCRDNVEALYQNFGDRDVYDIRHKRGEPGAPPSFMNGFLNLASTQEALGVDTNYTTTTNYDVFFAFQKTGDYVYRTFLEDLEHVLNSSVRVSLVYGE